MSANKQNEKPEMKVVLYVPIRRIRYHNPDHKLNGKLVESNSKDALAGLPMTHLSDKEINLLVAKRVIVKKS